MHLYASADRLEARPKLFQKASSAAERFSIAPGSKDFHRSGPSQQCGEKQHLWCTKSGLRPQTNYTSHRTVQIDYARLRNVLRRFHLCRTESPAELPDSLLQR
jgi:hypothetical protein